MAMTEHHRNTLRRARVYLIENMDIDTVVEHLISSLLLSGADEDTIQSKKTKRDQIKNLLDILPRKGDDGYLKLMTVLQEHQSFVYDELMRIDREHAPHNQRTEPIGQPQPVSPSYATGGVHSQPETCPQFSPSPIVHPTDQSSMDTTDSPACLQITGKDTGQLIYPVRTIPRSPQSLVNDKALSTLAAKLGGEWEQLAIHMGFAQNKLYHWKQGSPHSVWGQVFAMLDSWKKMNGNYATVERLTSVLATFEPRLDEAAYRHLYFE